MDNNVREKDKATVVEKRCSLNAALKANAREDTNSIIPTPIGINIHIFM